MARKTKADKEKTYLALIEAAAELFRSQGFTATTLNEIAERAGVTRGAFYGHFSSKSDVIRAIWEEQAMHILRAYRACFGESATGRSGCCISSTNQ